MARWPAPGRCKRRLAIGIGRDSAARVQAALACHAVAVARQAARHLDLDVLLASSGIGARASDRWARQLGCDGALIQGRGGLGLRLQRQVQRAFAAGVQRLVLIGSDLPDLDYRDLQEAFAALEEVPVVLGPAHDGGYWLIGLNRPCPGLFCGVPWGGDSVLASTEALAAARALTWKRLRRQADLDRPADLERWR
jgi:rSAM/selenodomain-associated transferase 1